MTAPQAPVRLVGDGLVLREWAERDLPRMVELLMSTGHLGYVLGPLHRGKGVAARAVVLIRDHGHDAGHDVLRLQISEHNETSNALARRTGFRLAPDQDEVVVDKGVTHRLKTWEHHRP